MNLGTNLVWLKSLDCLHWSYYYWHVFYKYYKYSYCTGVCYEGDHLYRIKYHGSILVLLVLKSKGKMLWNYSILYIFLLWFWSYSVRTNVSSCEDSNGLILRTVVHKDDIWMVSDLKQRKSNMLYGFLRVNWFLLKICNCRSYSATWPVCFL